jgi:hypothetical protein
MVDNYIKTLIKNLPQPMSNKSDKVIDIILDGGIFNGSYLIGALLFIKEMEKQNYLKVDKISGCSIGAFSAFLYHINALDIINEIYDMLLKYFKTNYTLDIFDKIFDKLDKILPDNVCETMSNRVYISYYNVVKRKKIVKCKYKNKREIFETIRKSCFFPFIIDGSAIYKNKYCDGFNPYILPICPNKKILYLDLYGADKINFLFSIRNEKTNFHRILAGVLDIHLFFIKQSNTQMCSYVNSWSFTNIVHNRIIKVIGEKVLFYGVYLYWFIKRYIPDEIYDSIICKIVAKIIHDIYIILIENYSL